MFDSGMRYLVKVCFVLGQETYTDCILKRTQIVFLIEILLKYFEKDLFNHTREAVKLEYMIIAHRL